MHIQGCGENNLPKLAPLNRKSAQILLAIPSRVVDPSAALQDNDDGNVCGLSIIIVIIIRFNYPMEPSGLYSIHSQREEFYCVLLMGI